MAASSSVSPTPVPSTSAATTTNNEKTNYIRLARLLVDVGTNVLQNLFDNIHPPHTLQGVLNSPNVLNGLKQLKTKKVLYTKQWDILYPASGCVTSKQFDITLLFLLLRNICHLKSPSTGWGNLPLPTDQTIPADLVRIKNCRNEIYAHKVKMALSETVFEDIWTETEAALIRLGGTKYHAQIQRLKIVELDVENEKCYKILLWSWEEGQEKRFDVMLELKKQTVREQRSLPLIEDQPKSITTTNPSTLAPSVLAAIVTAEQANYMRFVTLLVDVGTNVLQDVFDNIHPPHSLQGVLNSPKVLNCLKQLKTKRVLYTKQWDILYPASGCVTSKEFDITLLFLLLRNICNLKPPSTGWDNLPLPTDLTIPADLVRIKRYRNEICGHQVDMTMSKKKFKIMWDETKAALIRLGGTKYQSQIQRLKVEELDFEDKQLDNLLQSWEEDEKKVDDAIQELIHTIKDQHEETISTNQVIKKVTAGGAVLAWAAGSAYFLNRYKDDPEKVIQLVQSAILPSFMLTGLLAYSIAKK